MIGILLNILATALSLLVVDIIFPGVKVDSFIVAMVAGAVKYLGKINYTYLTPLLPLASCLLPIFTRKLILHDYLLV
ncbi:MAG: hypothetical protein EWV75_00850 [Microcystis wesenbergii Mw_QC_S_20081001_S30D]|uniref:Uncharacterized protein n=1 Tax=Microcystis wesenbergii Mw_QC_S_20081001_S30D TaxID=2486245 RepID=A0A552K0E3_9CHRO|nr:MAG: hypothetical protein EWV74_12435 [Microcystis wesenbergii Mw_QC_S_20081001_S30]TRV01498.1 MAG: hypothetical protein EWV75_00850 [Microcystis wesenbergii Mw_QC_S_20081001_S30D]